jgi:hypothetical protein
MGTNRQTTPQSITVDYLVTGSLDGVSLAPEVIIDQNDPRATPFDTDTQIFRPDPVPNLGLIDPDLLVGGSIGPRCIPFLSIDTTATGDPGASVDIVGVREAGEPDVFFQEQIQSLEGATGPIYLGDGFNVPQGSDIRLDGMSAPAGVPIRVRATILVPASCAEIAAFRCSCDDACCPPELSPFVFADVSTQPDAGWGLWQAGGGDSPFFILRYTGAADPAVRLRLGVDNIEQAAPPTAAMLQDPLFTTGTTPPGVSVSSVTPGTSLVLPQLELEFDMSVAENGPYIVRLKNPCGCTALFGILVELP